MTLTAIERFKGAKNKHPTTRCVCDCGKERVVRTTRLRLGRVTACAACAKTAAAKLGGETRRKLTASERAISDRFSQYKNNARKKALNFDLSLPLFSLLIASPCCYCGSSERVGVDRINNAAGYSEINCAPCCADCNFAKRDMTKDDFLALVARIHAHQSR